jgi:hypothetical protein
MTVTQLRPPTRAHPAAVIEPDVDQLAAVPALIASTWAIHGDYVLAFCAECRHHDHCLRLHINVTDREGWFATRLYVIHPGAARIDRAHWRPQDIHNHDGSTSP